ncbi:phosphoenolpyruvate synthase [bacterium]|nr:phosphoenolpyruvate synthase [bacterium]
MALRKFIRFFREITISDIPLVGGKNASLGEMVRSLTSEGIRVPDGFAITADAYRHFISANDLGGFIRDTITSLDTSDIQDLAEHGRSIRERILKASIPKDLEEEIIESYQELSGHDGEIDVAVRSSATAEDLPDASFAGQQESFLNIRGSRALLHACRECLASLFTDRAISYRHDKGFDAFSVALSIGVQRMVRSDSGSAGVMFTLDTESGFPDVILINGSYGLGESVVKGRVDPDEFLVFKSTLGGNFRPIIKRSIGAKQEKMLYATRGGRSTKVISTPIDERERLCLTDDDVLQLACWGVRIEQHYSTRAGHRQPMDIEWAKDGRTGELFIVQARPETVHGAHRSTTMDVYRMKGKGKVLLEGKSVGEKIGAGRVRVIRHLDELKEFKAGEILVSDMTDPDWEPTMTKAAGIVTNRGGRTCHAAIVSREIGVPCVVGTEKATSQLTDGTAITVSCAEGEVGRIYEGTLEFSHEKIDVATMKRPRTKVMLNVGNPEQAFSMSLLPNDGVGLARMEFIISSVIRVHPLALLRFDQLPEGSAKEQIDHLTHHYARREDYFIEKLAEGVGQIAAAFYPKDVIIRMSDFKTNEYANLLGGEPFEPKEENPMIGFRGASRYYDDRYRDGFLLECSAMKKVRETMGLTNLKLMIPFCRTVEEGRRVLDVMAKAGLKRGDNGLEVYVMCEIPSNVILTEEFAEIFDGFSIGSNDLTQLTLGLDRDSQIVAHLFDERNQAVKRLVADVIKRAKACGRKVGICGQAPSDYPEFARFLVECGIDSMSLNADTVIKTTKMILEMEEAG